MSEVGHAPSVTTGATTRLFPPIDLTEVLHQVHLGHAMVDPTADDLVAAAVNVARAAGMPWESIGQVIGVSGQTAHRRYATKAEPETDLPHPGLTA